MKTGIEWAGPYEIVAYNVGQNAIVRASKTYWGKPVNLDEVEFVDLGTDSGATIAALASGQVDGVYHVYFSELDTIKALPDINIHR